MRLLHLLKQVNESTQGILAEGNIHNVYDQMEQHATRQDSYFSDMEEAWTGGVGDFGNNKAAYAIQQHPQYYDYHDGLVQSVTQHLGDPFIAYRLLPAKQLQAWKQGDDLPPMGISISRRHAEAFKRFAPNQQRDDLVLVKFAVPSEAVIMLGHQGEQELVIDPNWVSAHEVETDEQMNEITGFEHVPERDDPISRKLLVSNLQAVDSKKFKPWAEVNGYTIKYVKRQNKNATHLFIFDQDDNAVGTAMVVSKDRYPKNHVHIGYIWIEPEHRNKKLALAIYKTLLDKGHTIMSDDTQSQHAKALWWALGRRYGLKAGYHTGERPITSQDEFEKAYDDPATKLFLGESIKPRIEPEQDMYRYDDGNIIATIDIGDYGAVIYEFSSRNPSQGNAAKALKYLKDKFGFVGVTDIGYPDDDSYAFWMHMLKKGLVDEVHDDQGGVHKQPINEIYVYDKGGIPKSPSGELTRYQRIGHPDKIDGFTLLKTIGKVKFYYLEDEIFLAYSMPEPNKYYVAHMLRLYDSKVEWSEANTKFRGFKLPLMNYIIAIQHKGMLQSDDAMSLGSYEIWKALIKHPSVKVIALRGNQREHSDAWIEDDEIMTEYGSATDPGNIKLFAIPASKSRMTESQLMEQTKCGVMNALMKYRPDLQSAYEKVPARRINDSILFLMDHNLWDDHAHQLALKMRAIKNKTRVYEPGESEEERATRNEKLEQERKIVMNELMCYIVKVIKDSAQ